VSQDFVPQKPKKLIHGQIGEELKNEKAKARHQIALGVVII
jgi:hypothetical protein